MTPKPFNEDEQYSEQEIAERRDALTRHLASKPPKPHSEMKIGKTASKSRKKKTPKRS